MAHEPTPSAGIARFCSFCGTALHPPVGICPRCAAGNPPPSTIWAQPYGQVMRAKTNGLAVASLVIGLVWLYGFGSILALAFGYTAKRQIDESNGLQDGRGMAVAGIAIGWFGLGSVVILSVLLMSVRQAT